MTALSQLAVALSYIVCGTCGVPHAIPETMHDEFARAGGFWYCPNGHRRGWHEGSEKTALKKLQAELDDERRCKDAALARANQMERAVTKARKELKSHKTRTKNGVCPCCNRTFQQLARHMANKHPEFTP